MAELERKTSGDSERLKNCEQKASLVLHVQLLLGDGKAKEDEVRQTCADMGRTVWQQARDRLKSE